MTPRTLAVTQAIALAILAIAGCGGPGQSVRSPAPQVLLDDLLQDQRKMVVLLESQEQDPTDVELVARFLYQRNRERLAVLLPRLSRDKQARTEFLDALERGTDVQDGDWLGLVDLLQLLPEDDRVRSARDHLGRLEQEYAVASSRMMQRLGGRSWRDGRPQPWQDYLRDLRSRFTPASILQEHRDLLIPVDPGARSLSRSDSSTQITAAAWGDVRCC